MHGAGIDEGKEALTMIREEDAQLRRRGGHDVAGRAQARGRGRRWGERRGGRDKAMESTHMVVQHKVVVDEDSLDEVCTLGERRLLIILDSWMKRTMTAYRPQQFSLSK